MNKCKIIWQLPWHIYISCNIICTYTLLSFLRANYDGKALEMVMEEHIAKSCTDIADHIFGFTSPKISF